MDKPGINGKSFTLLINDLNSKKDMFYPEEEYFLKIIGEPRPHAATVYEQMKNIYPRIPRKLKKKWKKELDEGYIFNVKLLDNE